MLIEAFAFLFFLIIVLALYLNIFSASRTLWKLSFTAFALRVGYVFIDSLIGIYAGGGDQTGYETTIWFVAKQWRSGVLLAPFHLGAGLGFEGKFAVVYSIVFGPVYAAFGRIPLLPRLQMALFGALAVVNIALIAERLHSRQAGVVAGGIATIFPYWVVLSGILYRDMLVIFFLTAMGYYLVRWQSNEHHWSILVVGVTVAMLGLSLRLINIVPIGVMGAIALFLSIDRDAVRHVGTVVSVLIGSGIFYLLYGDYLMVKELANRRSWLARPAPGSYLSEVIYQTYPELIAFAPIGALYFALTPFPWQSINFMAIIAIGQNLFLWYPIVILSIVGFRDILHIPKGPQMVLPIAGFALAGILAYGLVEGNIGPAIRHRSQFQFVFFVLAAVAVTERIELKGVRN